MHGRSRRRRLLVSWCCLLGIGCAGGTGPGAVSERASPEASDQAQPTDRATTAGDAPAVSPAPARPAVAVPPAAAGTLIVPAPAPGTVGERPSPSSPAPADPSAPAGQGVGRLEPRGIGFGGGLGGLCGFEDSDSDEADGDDPCS